MKLLSIGNNFTMKKSKWTRAQIDLLLEKTKTGNVRTEAFREIALRTNRKANSVRNYYYKNFASEKTAFSPFSLAEVNDSLREIVLGTSRGESVRSICLKLAGGDKTKMLRIQNKYRAVLRSQPQRIAATKNDLEAQGYLVKLPVQVTGDKGHVTGSIFMLPERKEKKLTDTDINNLFMGLMRLVKKQAEDGVKSQVENLRAEIERLKAVSSAKYNS